MTHLKVVCSPEEGVALDHKSRPLKVVCSPEEGSIPLKVVCSREKGVTLDLKSRPRFDRPGNSNRDNSKKDQNKSKNH